jgi:hypothetical protein
MPHWIPAVALLSAFLAMAWISWRKWPDLLIDFGMQLYVPWRLSDGAVLYKDVAYLTGGPLSQLYHSILFRIFGASMEVLVWSNVLITVVLLAFIYGQFTKCADRMTGTMVSLGVVLAFAFAQYLPIGNYNFMSPYSHEAFHGLVLSVFMVGCLAEWVRSGRGAALAAAGFLLGLVFLTKPELFLASAAALLFCFWMRWRVGGQASSLPNTVSSQIPAEADKDVCPTTGKAIIALIIAAIIPPALFLLSFLSHQDLPGSVKSVCWAWVPLLTTDVAQNAFYRWCLGLDAPWFNLRTAALHFVGLCVAIGFLAWSCRLTMTTSKGRLSFIACVALLVVGAVFFDWVNCGRSLPLILVTGIILLFRTGTSSITRVPEASIFALLWIAFSGVLLAKMGFHSRIWHYGFYLAMPAFVASVYILLWVLPQRLSQFGVHRDRFRGSLSLLMLVGFLRLAAQSNYIYEQKDFPIGSPGNHFITYPSKTEPATRVVAETLQWIEANVKPNETIAALPEGAMLNYLSRRSNSAPYMVFNPAETATFGETQMLAAYQASPPDYILLVHRDTSEFGVDFFGRKRGFGYEMMQWITNAYRPVHLIGDEPLKSHRFGIKILQRAGSP